MRPIAFASCWMAAGALVALFAASLRTEPIPVVAASDAILLAELRALRTEIDVVRRALASDAAPSRPAVAAEPAVATVADVVRPPSDAFTGEELRRMFSVLFWCLIEDDSELADQLAAGGRSPFDADLLARVEGACLELRDVERRRRESLASLRERLGIGVRRAPSARDDVRDAEYERAGRELAEQCDRERAAIRASLSASFADSR